MQYLGKITFSDEGHFCFSGYGRSIYKLSDLGRYQSSYGTLKANESSKSVWCGFWSCGIIGKYFFENEHAVSINVNGECYRDMINTFLWPKEDDMDIDDMWFQHYGTTCILGEKQWTFFSQKWEGRVISPIGDVHWPTRS